MISVDKYSRSCNVLSGKICVLKETKDVNVKAFHIITNKNQAKAMENIFHMIINAISIICECKKYRTYKREYSLNRIT